MRSTRAATLFALSIVALALPAAAQVVVAPAPPVAPAPAPVPVSVKLLAGDDGWMTTHDGTTVLPYDVNPLPAGFFGAGSDAFAAPLVLSGRPIANSGGLGGAIDTIVRRTASTGQVAVGACAGVPTSFVSLHLESDPFTVTYGGAAAETWKIVAGLSTSAAQPPGSMRICNVCGTGGTFSASVKAFFLLRYVRVSPTPAIEIVQDCGLGACPLVTFTTSGAAWSLASSAASMPLDPLPAGVQLDVDADGLLDGVATIGKSNFQGGITTCGTGGGGGGGGGGAPECAKVDHVSGGGQDHNQSSHGNYAAGTGDFDGDGIPDHCCPDEDGDGMNDSTGEPCEEPVDEAPTGH